MVSMRTWVDGVEITSKVKGVQYHRRLNSINQATIRLHSYRGDLISTYAAKIGKDVYIRDGTNSYYLFRGRLQRIMSQNHELVLVVSDHLGQLQDKHILDDYIYYQGIVQQIVDSLNIDMYDLLGADPGWVTDIWKNKGLLFYEKNYPDEEKKYCLSVTFTGGSYSAGTHDQTHYTSTNSYCIIENDTVSNAYVQFDYTFADFINTDCENLILEFRLYFDFQHTPPPKGTLYIWNWFDSSWDKWRDWIAKSEWDITSFRYEKLLDGSYERTLDNEFDGNMNHYMGTGGDAGKVRFRFEITPKVNGDYGAFRIYYLNLTVEDEAYSFNPLQYNISTNDTNTLTTNTDDANFTTDGIQEQDKFVIVEQNKYIVEDIINAYSDLTIDSNNVMFTAYYTALKTAGATAFSIIKRIARDESASIWESTGKEFYLKNKYGWFQKCQDNMDYTLGSAPASGYWTTTTPANTEIIIIGRKGEFQKAARISDNNAAGRCMLDNTAIPATSQTGTMYYVVGAKQTDKFMELAMNQVAGFGDASITINVAFAADGKFKWHNGTAWQDTGVSYDAYQMYFWKFDWDASNGVETFDWYYRTPDDTSWTTLGTGLDFKNKDVGAYTVYTTRFRTDTAESGGVFYMAAMDTDDAVGYVEDRILETEQELAITITEANLIEPPKISKGIDEIWNRVKCFGRTIDGEVLESEWHYDNTSISTYGTRQKIIHDESCRTIRECEDRAEEFLQDNKEKPYAISIKIRATQTFIETDILGRLINISDIDGVTGQYQIEGIIAEQEIGLNTQLKYTLELGTQPINRPPQHQMAEKLLELHYDSMDNFEQKSNQQTIDMKTILSNQQNVDAIHDKGFAKIADGTYTGDGTDDWSKSITIGFRAKLILIYRYAAADSDDAFLLVGMDNATTDRAILLLNNADYLRDNKIQIEDLGFNISDDGANLEPNGSGETYCYVCFG